MIFFGNKNWLRVAIPLLTFFVLSCARCQNNSDKNAISAKIESSSFRLNINEATNQLKFFVEEPHPFGSKRQAQIKNFLEKQIQSLNKSGPIVQEFTVEVPNPKITPEIEPGPRPLTENRIGFNVYTQVSSNDVKSNCVVILGSHYDTKNIDGIRYVGANDSASSSVLLLQLLKESIDLQDKQNYRCDIGFLWLDGEESVLPGWDDGRRSHPSGIEDHTYGSRFFVSQLVACTSKERKCLKWGGSQIEAFVLLDMIGSKSLKISRDMHSSPELRKALESEALALGLESILSIEEKFVADDHQAFLAVGIPAIDLIDFENQNTWHNNFDTLDSISLESIEVAGRLALALANRLRK